MHDPVRTYALLTAIAGGYARWDLHTYPDDRR
jgi:hypothetical protein